MIPMKSACRAVAIAVFMLVLFFLSQDICLWTRPRILHYPAKLQSLQGIWVCWALFHAAPGALFLLVRGFQRRRDRDALLSELGRALACIVFAVGVFSIIHWTSARRSAAFARAALNGAPVIAALSQYRADTGSYPESLDQLLPKYIGDIPYTGLVGYPYLVYRKDSNDNQTVYDSYELRINCSSNVNNFDRFIYWPSESYPTHIQGNRTEPIGRWVYVHE